MSEISVIEDLEFLGVARQSGEAEQSFLKRLALKANEIKDAEWETLAESTQLWVNEALQAVQDKTPIPTFDGEVPEAAPATAPKKAAAPKADKATKAKKAKEASAPRGPKGGFSLTDKITILADENPYRKGTKSAGWFDLYKKGMTVEEAIKAGAPRHHIRWDIKRGRIKVG